MERRLRSCVGAAVVVYVAGRSYPLSPFSSTRPVPGERANHPMPQPCTFTAWLRFGSGASPGV